MSANETQQLQELLRRGFQALATGNITEAGECCRLALKAGYKKSTAHTGAVTLIQRFGSALNLNIHFHMLFLDGVYVGEASSSARFRQVKAPTCAELTQLTHTIANRLASYLERQGLLERDAEHSYLTLDNANCPSSNKWNRGSDYLVESFVPRYHVTRHAAGSANDVSRWSSS